MTVAAADRPQLYACSAATTCMEPLQPGLAGGNASDAALHAGGNARETVRKQPFTDFFGIESRIN
ncbi:hypothetical protein [Comamonas terrae]|uniref:Uncharacterized protein n=1 Tax=Comamonas terrae TaxID=673548 RepID=A0ABW5UIC9_9BURK|nr:hypothetical protein [Comamonas terrae]